MPPISDIIWMEAVDSTNAEVLRRISTLDNLSVIATNCQTAGRGQGDHKWHSSPGENLTCSILLRFPSDGNSALKASEALYLTRIITLAILDLLEEEGVSAWIKWPNDIWVGERKVCGILIENRIRSGYVTESVIGVGLNLNETAFPADLPNPVSLKQLNGRSYDPQAVLERLLGHVTCRQGQYADPTARTELSRQWDQSVTFRMQSCHLQ